MKIKIAKTAGFCMGVRRAVDLAVDYSSGQPGKIFTLGPLIHNNQTIEMLRERGVETLGDRAVKPGEAKILIRAHGIPPDLQEKYHSQGHIIIDGTCPKVKTVHKVIQKYRDMGYDIVIAGDEGHAEVVGLLGYAGDSGHLIQTAEDINALEGLKKICLVSQTTFDRQTFDEIGHAIAQKFAGTDIVIKKTICSATDRRQEEIREMAQDVDAMVVVGGKNSANTLRLAKISRACGTPTQHVETPEEIDWEQLKNCATVGVSAGASTPNWMIRRVAEHIQYIAETRQKSAKNIAWRIFNAAGNLNVFVALGSVALYYVSCVIQNFVFSWRGAAISFLYFLSMYLWNSLVNVDQMRHLGLNRYQFYRAHRSPAWSIAVICILLLLWISIGGSRSLFVFMLFCAAAGSAYHLTIVPPVLRIFVRYKNLKDIPTSRDLFVALAWSVVMTFVPQALAGVFVIEPATVLTFGWIFMLAYLRSVLFDLRDIEGDRIMGRETLVIIVGEKRARIASLTTLWLACGALVLFAVYILLPQYAHPGPRPIAVFLQVLAVFYLLAFMRASRKISMNRAALFNFFADAQFYIAGLGAWLATIIGRNL